MPHTGTDYWYATSGVVNDEGDPDTGKYNNIVNNIGNLFVIDPTTNLDAYNYDFPVKKAFYQEHLQDWSVARITVDKTQWTPTDIESRAVEIVKWATGYWKF